MCAEAQEINNTECFARSMPSILGMQTQSNTKKNPANMVPISKFKNRWWKKLSQNTFSFTYHIVILPGKEKGLLQNLHNFNSEGATGPQNSKDTI